MEERIYEEFLPSLFFEHWFFILVLFFGMLGWSVFVLFRSSQTKKQQWKENIYYGKKTAGGQQERQQQQQQQKLNGLRGGTFFSFISFFVTKVIDGTKWKKLQLIFKHFYS